MARYIVRPPHVYVKRKVVKNEEGESFEQLSHFSFGHVFEDGELVESGKDFESQQHKIKRVTDEEYAKLIKDREEAAEKEKAFLKNKPKGPLELTPEDKLFEETSKKVIRGRKL